MCYVIPAEYNPEGIPQHFHCSYAADNLALNAKRAAHIGLPERYMEEDRGERGTRQVGGRLTVAAT